MNKRQLANDFLNGKIDTKELRRAYAMEYFKTAIDDLSLDFVVYLPGHRISVKVLELLQKGEPNKALELLKVNAKEIETTLTEFKSRPDFDKLDLDRMNNHQKAWREELAREGKL